MPRVDALVQSPIASSFRVQQVAGLFDLPAAEKSTLTFTADLPGLDEDWKIGAIVGPSGSGKSVLARKAYADGAVAQGALIERFDWPSDRAIVDAFDESLPGQAITTMLGSVGFSSPPAWLRPHHVLSNGEQFRCDLARALLLDQPVVVVDEFTSVIDRQVARFASAAIAHAMRKNPSPVRCGRFVAVTCHNDVLPWLSPDWWLDTATGQVHWGSVQQPAITLALHRCSQSLWPVFARHHYLSASLNPAARCYTLLWEDKPIALVATMHQHAAAPRRRVHRLVVLPDYQGMGIGPRLLNAVAQIESHDRTPVSIVTSHPVLIRSLDRSTRWRRTRTQKLGANHTGFMKRFGRSVGSAGRATASFLYHPDPSPRGAIHDPIPNLPGRRPTQAARPGTA